MSVTTTISGWDVLDAAHQALRETAGGIRADDWDRPTPCAGWSVAQVLQHAVGDQIGFAAALTGEPGPTFDPFSPTGELTGDRMAFLEDALGRSARAWAGVDREASEVPTPVPPHKMSPWSGSAACALDAGVHAWDIAVAIGRPSPLTPELAGPLMTVARQIVEPLRAWGAYATALPPQDGDDVAALLRYLGRDPHWAVS